jgi:hypothetical protein
VHRVMLNGRLGDGGAATLILDPNAPKFDQFGQPIAQGKALPLVSLAVTVKHVKSEAGLHRFELRGPKITSRLSVVLGTGLPYRFIVSGKEGEVLYLVNMNDMPRFPPCHPGCFPAGTPIRVPDGVKAIEALRIGDLVTTVAPDGTARPAATGCMNYASKGASSSPRKRSPSPSKAAASDRRAS